MHIFYTTAIQENTATLDEIESHHCIKVLRLKTGDVVILVDGIGGFFEGVISIPDHRSCKISINKIIRDYGKRNYKVHVAIAPTKNIERFEWFLEKSTEIGIDEITPLICQRSERKILRQNRLEKVITSAVKQSVKAYHPVFHPMINFERFLESKFTGTRLIAHCMEDGRQELIKMKPANSDFTVLIGPEGDFSEAEVKLAISKGFIPISLGASRLRTETAGIVVCQIISDLLALS
jgi:16S rRNA (uracil1498-N3)-methyltransferase